MGDSLDSVEALIKKHEDFEKSLAAQEEKIKALDEFASKLIEGQHYAAEDVSQRRALLLQRRNALLEKSAMRRATLDANFKLMQFERDCDETNGWIRGKLKFANDDSYLVSHWFGIFCCFLEQIGQFYNLNYFLGPHKPERKSSKAREFHEGAPGEQDQNRRGC